MVHNWLENRGLGISKKISTFCEPHIHYFSWSPFSVSNCPIPTIYYLILFIEQPDYNFLLINHPLNIFHQISTSQKTFPMANLNIYLCSSVFGSNSNMWSHIDYKLFTSIPLLSCLKAIICSLSFLN